MVAEDPELNEITGIDIFIGIVNSDKGTISGNLHLSNAYQDKSIVVVANRITEEEGKEVIEMWPSAVVFTSAQAGSETRAFQLTNLPDGNYRIYSFTSIGEDYPLLGMASPYGPYVIDSGSKAKDYSGEVFYMGLKDDNWGSVSGKIVLPTSIAEGALAIYISSGVEVEGTQPGEEYVQWSPESIVFVKQNSLGTETTYTVGNLKDDTQVTVAAILYLNPEKSSIGAYPEWWSPQALKVAFSPQAGDEQKHWSNININVSITEMSGTLSIDHNSFQAQSPAWSMIYLASIKLSL